LITGPRSESRLGAVMQRMACGLSNTTGRAISSALPRVKRVPIAQVVTRAGAPETEAVGIYLLIKGELRGQAVLILPLTSALNLVDLLLDEPLGTTDRLGVLARSALAEIGNITLSYFLNAVAALTWTPNLLRPSPPAMLVDELSAVLDVIVTTMGAARNDLLIIETTFKDVENIVQARFWVLPNPAALDLKA
jgi:chemotaxis protein CheC